MATSNTDQLIHINTIAVLGAGTMGVGITQACLEAGYAINLFDTQQPSLKRAFEKLSAHQQNLALCETVLSAVENADLVIEAVPEDLAIKHTLFEKVYSACANNHVIWCSNTSSIAIALIAKHCPDSSRFAGLHFFNPVSKMRLVEIIQSEDTSPETVAFLKTFIGSLKNKAAVLAKDTPGFIVNRVARPFYGEALKILGEYGADKDLIQTIDSVMKEAGQFRMGPFELMDLIGIDVNLAVTQSVYQAYCNEPRYQPHPIQQAKVNAMQLGRKTGKGFYDYV